MLNSARAVLAFVLGLAGVMMIFTARGAAAPDPNARRAFREIWRNKQVYLLIPREQGEARGFRRRRTLVFRYAQPDAYVRGVTQLGDVVFFDRFRVPDIGWKRDRLEMVLHRPPYPEEYALVSASGVSVVVEIHFGEAGFDLVQTNDILSSFLVFEETFPQRLRLGGEGPPKLTEAIVDLSAAKTFEQVVPGKEATALISLLGSPLETQRLLLGQTEYEYQWFADFHGLVLLRNKKVLSAHWLSF